MTESGFLLLTACPQGRGSWVLFAVIALACAHCGKGAASAAAGPSVTTSVTAPARDASAEDEAGEPMDAREAEAWARAVDGGDDDDIRLADKVGCEGLRERASSARLRPIALRAMAYCSDFSQLPWLADVGAHGSDADALEALDSAVAQAARVRRATDAEDADELHAGCAALLALARATDRPAPRRVRAIRALAMLADWGCVKRADIPTDLDAR